MFVSNFVSSPVEAFKQSEAQSIEIQQKRLRALNCRKNKENKENECVRRDVAQAKGAQYENACGIYPQLCEIRSQIDLYNPNYVMYSASNHNDNAVEIQYSGRYNIKTVSCVKDNEKGLYIDAKDNEKGLYIDDKCVEASNR